MGPCISSLTTVINFFDIPKSPVINNRTALLYKLVRYFTKTLDQYISLNNYFNVTNSTNFANDLTKLEVHENHTMYSFHIEDLYVSTLIDETINVIKNNYCKTTTFK